MKILGILFTILFSSLALTHGQNKYGRSHDSPVQYKSAVDCNDGSVQYIVERPQYVAYENPKINGKPAAHKIGALPHFESGSRPVGHNTIHAGSPGSYQKNASPDGYHAAPEVQYVYGRPDYDAYKTGAIHGETPGHKKMSMLPNFESSAMPAGYSTIQGSPSGSHQNLGPEVQYVANKPDYMSHEAAKDYGEPVGHNKIVFLPHFEPYANHEVQGGASGPSQNGAVHYVVDRPDYEIHEAPKVYVEAVNQKKFPSLPSFEPSVNPAGYDVIQAGPSGSYQNAVPEEQYIASRPQYVVLEPAKIYPESANHKTVGALQPYEKSTYPAAYDSVHTGSPVSLPSNLVGLVSYENVPSHAPNSYQKNIVPDGGNTVPVNLFVSYQKGPGYDAEPSSVSISYQKTLNPTAYGPASAGPSVYYQKKGGPADYSTVPSGLPSSDEKNIDPVGYNLVPVGSSIPSGIPISYENSVRPVNYDAALGVPHLSYQKSPSSVGYNSAPSGVSISYKKNGAHDDCNEMPVGPSVYYQNKPSSVSYGALPLDLSLSYHKNVGFGPVPAGTSNTYGKNTSPVDYNRVPLSVSISYQKNSNPASYDGTSAGPSHLHQKDGYNKVPAELSTPYGKNADNVGYGRIPSSSYHKYGDPLDHNSASAGPSISYQKRPDSVSYGAVPLGASSPYQKNVDSDNYEGRPIGQLVSYEKDSAPLAHGKVPSGISISYHKNIGSNYVTHSAGPYVQNPISSQKNVGSGSNAILVGPYPENAIPYQKNTDSTGNYGPSYASPSHSHITGPSEHNTPSQSAPHYEEDHNPAGYAGSTYAPSNQSPYMVISSAQRPSSYGQLAGSGDYSC